MPSPAGALIDTGKSASIYQCNCRPGIPTVALVLTRPLRSRLPEGLPLHPDGG
jgi:hypothetical protein